MASIFRRIGAPSSEKGTPQTTTASRQQRFELAPLSIRVSCDGMGNHKLLKDAKEPEVADIKSK